MKYLLLLAFLFVCVSAQNAWMETEIDGKFVRQPVPEAAYNATPSTRKRWSSVTLFADSNLSGANLPLNIGQALNLVNAVPNLANKVSSVQVAYGAMMFAYTNQGYTGTCWAFMFVNAYSMSDYGLNDNIESVSVVATPIGGATGIPAVILFSDSQLRGKSIVVGPGNYNSITSAAYYGCGNFPNDGLSSYVVLPYTKVIFYRDSNRSNVCGTVSNAGSIEINAGFPNLPMVCGNDMVSSLDVVSCTLTSC